MSEVYNVPGVHVVENDTPALSIQSGETAVPVFVGVFNSLTTVLKSAAPACVRVESWLDFTSKFGVSDHMHVSVGNKNMKVTAYQGSYSVRLYFENGGGPCYILAFNSTDIKIDAKQLLIASAIKKCPDITLLCWCEFFDRALDDAIYTKLDGLLSPSPATGGNPGMFLLADAWADAPKDALQTDWKFSPPTVNNPTQVATYFPGLKTSYTRDYKTIDERAIVLTDFTQEHFDALKDLPGFASAPDLAALNALNLSLHAFRAGVPKVQTKDFAESEPAPDTSSDEADDGDKVTLYDDKPQPPLTPQALLAGIDMQIAASIAEDQSKADPVYLRASVAMAGVYARVDRERGVWKAPANVGLTSVTGLIAPGFDGKVPDNKVQWPDPKPVLVDETLNGALVNSKINAIRSFSGRGVMVWGARTMCDPSLTDWRYVSVRRLFNTIERDARSALQLVVFEPNSPPTWETVRGGLENYLHSLWRQGALPGETPEQAYYVHLGLGNTMTQDDVNQGKLIVRVGVAAVRPAEFIVLELTQNVAAG